MGTPYTISKHFSLSPLDAACLLVLAERLAGGGRVDETAVVGKLLRAGTEVLLGFDVTSVRADVHEGASPQARRDAYAAKLREMLKEREERKT